jgi:lysozyme family protein
MKANFATALQALLVHEGGFSNHPDDPGGMTNLGVTKAVWEEWRGRPVSEKEMRALTPEIVAPMYKRRYWDKIAGDHLPAGLDLAVFDFAVNSGPGRAAKVLQRVLGVSPDGDIGPQTLMAVGAMPLRKLLNDYNAARMSFLMSLPTWDTFGKGWGRRVAEVTSQASTMTG